LGKCWLIIVGGLFLVVVGARILVPNAAKIAYRIGVPEDVISATMVAFDTSLPELMTAIAAVRKGHPEITEGNIVLTFTLFTSRPCSSYSTPFGSSSSGTLTAVSRKRKEAGS
jgi:hypothetical protein